MTQKEQNRNTALPATALYALLLVCVLALTAFGANIYGAVTAAHNAGSAQRAALSYLCVRLRAADEAGAVTVTTGPEGDALILAEPLAQSGYATRIYLWQGQLVEDYAPADSAFAPANAQPIAKTAAFTATVEGNLVRVHTEQGSAVVHLHSEGGAP